MELTKKDFTKLINKSMTDFITNTNIQEMFDNVSPIVSVIIDKYVVQNIIKHDNFVVHEELEERLNNMQWKTIHDNLYYILMDNYIYMYKKYMFLEKRCVLLGYIIEKTPEILHTIESVRKDYLQIENHIPVSSERNTIRDLHQKTMTQALNFCKSKGLEFAI